MMSASFMLSAPSNESCPANSECALTVNCRCEDPDGPRGLSSSVRAREMNASHSLTVQDMERPRSPDEFYNWVMGKCEELGATLEAKAFARSGAVLPKKFYDELFPLAIFVRREYSGRHDVRITPNLGSENFDATISIGVSGDEKILVEITCSKDGYDDSLRMEYLTKHGHVNLTGPVSVTGRRGAKDRSVNVESEAADHSSLVERQLSMLRERIEAKASKHYGANHTLLVAVDDYFPLREEEDAQKINKFVSGLLPQLDLDFARVVIAGVAGKIFLSYRLEI